jgi:hypothetical protein
VARSTLKPSAAAGSRPYDATPVARSATDILPANESERREAKSGPEAKGKWLTASVTDDGTSVVCESFDEAARRDPEHERDRVALVDGNNHQSGRIEADAKAREVKVTIVCDLVQCSSTRGRRPDASIARATPPPRLGSAANNAVPEPA